MADYRGLTIRIGGDTSALERALSNATKAANNTEKQLRRMRQALKFNPGDMSAMGRQLSLMDNKIESLSAKSSLLSESLKRLGSSVPEGAAKNVRSLAKGIKNVSQNMVEANQAYNDADAALERFYTRIAAMDSVKAEGIDIQSLKENSSEYIELLAEIGAITEKDRRQFHALKDAWHEANDGLTTAKAVSEYRNLETQLIRTKAEMKGLITQMANETAGMAIAHQFQGINREINTLNVATDTTSKRLKKLQSAFENLGTKSAKADYMRGLEEHLDVTRRKALELNNELNKPANAQYKKLSDETHNLAESIEMAKRKQDELRNSLESARQNLSFAEENGKDVKKLKAEVKQLEEAYKGAREEVKKFAKADEFRNKEAELAELKGEVERLKRTLEEVDGAECFAEVGHDAEKAKEEVRELGQAAEKTAAEVEEASVQANEVAAGAAQNTKIVANGLSEAGRWLSTRVTLPLTILGSKVGEVANTVDSSFRDMTKTVNGTDEEFMQLRAAALDFSTTHITSADQILEIEAMGGQLGIAKDNLQKFSEVVSQLDIATDVDATEMAKSIGQLSNIMKDFDQGKDLDNFANSLVRLGNNMPTTENEIMEVTKRIASMSSVVGMSTPDMLAWSAAIASTGQKSESAGTAINKTMSQIQALVSNGGKALKQGGADLEDYARVAGMTAQQFAEAWSKDPSAALQAFVQGLSHAGSDADKVLQDLDITSVRQKQALEGLAMTSENLGRSIQMSNDAWNGVADQWGAAGDAAREADKKSQGFSGALAKLKNSAQVLAASFGDALAPALKRMADGLAVLAKGFSHLPEPARQFLAVALAITAALGPLLMLTGGVMNAFLTLPGSIGGFASALSGMVSGIRTGSAALDLLKIGLGGIATAGAVAAVAIGVKLVSSYMEAQRREEEFSDSLKNLDQAFDESIRGLDDYKGGLAGIGNVLEELDGAVEEAEKGNGALAQTFRDNHDSAQKQADTIDILADRIIAYQQATSHTKAEQQQFNEDIRKFNELTGSHIGILDAESGKIGENGKAYADAKTKVKEYAKAKKELMEQELLLKDLTSASHERAKQGRALADAKNHLDELKHSIHDARKEYESATKSEGVFSSAAMDAKNKWQDLEAQLPGATDDVNKLKGSFDNLKQKEKEAADALDGHTAALNGSKTAIDEYLKSMGLSEESIKRFKEVLAAAGVSEEEFTDKTNTEKGNWVQAYQDFVAAINGSASDMDTALDEMGVKASDTTGLMREAWFSSLDSTTQGVLARLMTMSGLTASELARIASDTGMSGNEISNALADGIANGEINVDSNMQQVEDCVRRHGRNTERDSKTSADNTTRHVGSTGSGAAGKVAGPMASWQSTILGVMFNVRSRAQTIVAQINAALANIRPPRFSMPSIPAANRFGGGGWMGRRSYMSAPRAAMYAGMGVPGGTRLIRGGGSSRQFAQMYAVPGRPVKRDAPDYGHGGGYVYNMPRGITDGSIVDTYVHNGSSQAQATGVSNGGTEELIRELRELKDDLGSIIADNSPVRVVTDREAARYIKRVTG